jgi:threonylcarbamoyladenosine tRNA methylthiotransferase MtaB
MSESTLDNPSSVGAMGPAPTVAVLSLGCRANQEEIECILGSLRERGFRLTDFGRPADWVVINTCSVTSAGESDARQMIRRAVRESGGGRIVVTGCYAQMDPDAAARLGADLVVGNGEKWRLPELLASAAEGADGCTGVLFAPDPTTRQFLRHASQASGYRTRAALKIQDGCDERCTYCIIPALRGRGVSRDPEEVLAEAHKLVASGHPEITLTGIHSASYRWEGAGLASLLDRLLDVEGLRRIRVNSLEPQWVDAALIEAIASSPRFARHLHLPLQSGDAAVLKRMGRGYSPGDYARVIEQARRRIPGVAIGADVMVGFPGEEEDAFQRTAALIEDVRPAYLHVFPYSARPGTAAGKLPGAVDPRTARSRADRLGRLDRELRSDFLRACEGEEHEILLESRRDRQGRLLGLTDTFIHVAVATARPVGSWIRVRLRWGGSPRQMIGEPLE